MESRFIKENALTLLGMMVGAFSAGWIGAIAGGFLGLILDNVLSPFRKK